MNICVYIYIYLSFYQSIYLSHSMWALPYSFPETLFAVLDILPGFLLRPKRALILSHCAFAVIPTVTGMFLWPVVFMWTVSLPVTLTVVGDTMSTHIGVSVITSLCHGLLKLSFTALEIVYLEFGFHSKSSL